MSLIGLIANKPDGVDHTDGSSVLSDSLVSSVSPMTTCKSSGFKR